MRCQCCNRSLNDYESTNRALDGSFLDTCNGCLKGLGIPQLPRPDLNPYEEPEDEDDMFEEYVEEIDDDFEWFDED